MNPNHDEKGRFAAAMASASPKVKEKVKYHLSVEKDFRAAAREHFNMAYRVRTPKEQDIRIKASDRMADEADAHKAAAYKLLKIKISGR